MVDTTLTPSPEQCSRLMVAAAGPSACRDTTAAAGSGGVYSTPRDMQRWMQQFLSSSASGRAKPPPPASKPCTSSVTIWCR